jgi:hypothetical protein
LSTLCTGEYLRLRKESRKESQPKKKSSRNIKRSLN